ncbi:MAG TPA: glycoside hydrolase [Solirubrobacteraceae bacterium]|nr:glycoside hydrolase [Solirubrobacteraceae bacterium]
MVAIGSCAAGCGSSPAPSPPHLEPQREQKLDGWGVSLAWWAELAGGWGSEQREALARLLFGDPAKASGLTADGHELYPLGLNVARYNLGASAPGARCTREFRPGAEVPTVMPTSTSRPDLSLDSRQIAMLELAKSLIEARHLPSYLEAFANSPPWWLVRNGCPQGDGGTSVLAGAEQAARYGAYLAEVVNAFRAHGIRFTSLDPVNEPTIEWACSKAGSCQEGAYFDDEPSGGSSALAQVVRAACEALAPLGVPVSAPDGNSPDDTLAFVERDLPSLGCVQQVNTHSYENGASPYRGDKRATLAAAVHTPSGTPDKPARGLWMSEFGDAPASCVRSGVSGEDAACTGTNLAVQIADDLNGLVPQAWVYWTAMEGPSGWGLFSDASYPEEGQKAVAASVGEALTPSARFWALGQYTRFIAPGSTIVPVSSSGAGGVRMVVAKTDSGVVVVATNPSAQQQPLRLDLSAIGVSTESLRAYRTDATSTQAAVSAGTLTDGVLSDRLPGESISTYVLTAGGAGPAPGRPSGPRTTDIGGIVLRDAGAPFPGIGATYDAFAGAHRAPANQTPPYTQFDPVGLDRDTFFEVGRSECPTAGEAAECITSFTLYLPHAVALATAERLAATTLPADARVTSRARAYYVNHNYPEGDCVVYTSASLGRRMSSDGRVYAFYSASFRPYEPTITYHYSPAHVTFVKLETSSGAGGSMRSPCSPA